MPSPTPPPKKRRRPPLACFQCRRRKVKCDQLKPCTNCTKSKVPECTFPETEIPGTPWSLPSDSPATKSRRVDPPRPTSRDSSSLHPALLQEHGHHQRDLLQEPAVPDRPASSTPSSAIVSTAGRLSHDDTLRQRISELEATVRQLSSSDNTPRSSLVDPAPVTSCNSKLKFGNQSTWINGTSLFSHILQPLGQAQTKQSPLRDSITNFKALGGQVDQHTTVTPTPVVTGTRIPERRLADEFVQGYFTYFEGWLRVLHVPTFRAEYEKFWQQRDNTSEIFVLQLQVCMALGIVASPDCLQWKNSASQWLFEGRRWLQGSFEKMKRKPTFEELQLACLILIAEANASENDQMHQCWVSSGVLVRQAMCLGLHREPRHSRDLSVMDVEMRRRIWATVLELNLLLSLQAGQPTLISTTHYDTYPPSNMMDQELSDTPSDASSRERLDHNTETRIGTAQQLALFNSFNLRSDLVDKLSGIGQDMSYDEVLRFHEELSKAKGRMQQNFKASHATTAGSTHNAITNIILSRYLLALHLPVLGRSIKDPTFHFSRRFCVSTSIDMIKVSGILDGQDIGRKSNIFVEPSIKRLFINSPGLFRHIAVQAVFAIALELVTSKEEDYEERSVFPVWDDGELIQCSKAAEAWAASRLQAGITDHRVYCFIGAVIAYANALDARVPEAELGNVIVEAALRNADNCSNLMRGVAEKLGVFANQGNSALAATENLTTVLPDVTGLSMDLTSSFFGVGMDGFAFDWTYPLDLGVNPTGIDIGPAPL